MQIQMVIDIGINTSMLNLLLFGGSVTN